MTYNLTGLDTANNFAGIVSAISSIDPTFFIFVLLASWIILFISFKNYETKTALLITNFLVSIFAGLMYFAELIPFQAVGILASMFIFSIVLKIFADN